VDRKEQLSKIIQSGDAIKRLTDTTEWKEFLVPLLEQKLEQIKKDAFKPEFINDHILYVKQAAKYEAFNELIVMLSNAQNAASRALKDLEELDGNQS